MPRRTAGGNAALRNVHNDVAHITNPAERRRLALARIDKAPVGWSHVRAVVVSGVGFFTDAYDIFAINLASAMLGVAFWQSSHNGKIPVTADTAIKLATSAGTVLGQVGFGVLADIVGRKRMYGWELMIIIVATLAQSLSASSPAVSIVGLLIFWRVIMGIGIGGDCPLSSVITSEFATTKWRGAMMAAVFAMQGIGQLAAALVALVVTMGFKESLMTSNNAAHCSGECGLAVDKMWRVIIGLGAVPGCIALYFRLTIPETPRYTFDVAGDVEQADSDVQAYWNGSGGKQVAEERQRGQTIDERRGTQTPMDEREPLQTIMIERSEDLNPPKASWTDFFRHYGQ